MSFDDIIIGNLGWIARIAFRFCKNKPDADDLAQETLCRIYANRDKYNNARDFKPWALTIMTNIVKTQQARKERAPCVGIDDAIDVLSAAKTDSLAHFNEILDAIHKSAVKSSCVQCVLLYANGYSYDEIAKIEGIKYGTVKSRISSGRIAIRKALE